jgi:hypothetical protein
MISLGAAAHVIVRALPFDRYLDLVLRAVAKQRPACKILCRGFQSAVNRWMYLDATHDDFLLLDTKPAAGWGRAVMNLAPDDAVQASEARVHGNGLQRKW